MLRRTHRLPRLGPCLAATLTFLAVPNGGSCQGARSNPVVSSDPELAALAGRLLPRVEEWSGLAALGPVRVEMRSRDQLESYLVATLDEEVPEERARSVTAAYRLLGLVSSDFDLRETLLGVYREQVAGFYEPDSATLFVLRDQTGSMMEPLLVHELVHALQDQWLDLDSITDHDLVGSDRANAAHAALEGHATLVMMMSAAGDAPPALGSLRGTLTALRAGVESVATSAYPELARAPSIIRKPLLSLYLDGALFVLRAWEADNRPSLSELIPASTEQVLGGTDDPVGLELEVSGGRVVWESQLGRLELGILVEELLGEGWDGLADGWGGDGFALVESDDGAMGLFWYLVLDDAESQSALAEALADGFGAHHEPATVDTLDIDGRPGIVVRIGETGTASVRVGVERG